MPADYTLVLYMTSRRSGRATRREGHRVYGDHASGRQSGGIQRRGWPEWYSIPTVGTKHRYSCSRRQGRHLLWQPTSRFDALRRKHCGYLRRIAVRVNLVRTVQLSQNEHWFESGFGTRSSAGQKSTYTVAHADVDESVVSECDKILKRLHTPTECPEIIHFKITEIQEPDIEAQQEL
jgi:hypothetical protein